MKRSLSEARLEQSSERRGKYSRLQQAVRQQLIAASSRINASRTTASNVVVVPDAAKNLAPKPSSAILAAINDEAVVSVASIYSPHPTIGGASYNREREDLTVAAPSLPASVVETPLYMLLRPGESVEIQTSDHGSFAPGTILAVIHRGYSSARCDVKLAGDQGTVTVPWNYVRRIKDEGRDPSAPSLRRNGVDAFGRKIPDVNLERRAEEDSSTLIRPEHPGLLRDEQMTSQQVYSASINSKPSVNIVNVHAIQGKAGAWKSKFNASK